MPTLKTNGIELAYEVRGDGEDPPLLLLHGFSGSAADWRHVFDLDALTATHRAILVDARGHGRSTGGDAVYSHRQCALDAIALLEHLGVARVRAIGMSMGGNTLLHVATIAPARIDAMVIVSATMSYPPEARAIMRASPDAQPRAWADSTDDMAFTPPDLARIAARTLVVYGDRDPLYPVEMGVAIYRAIPDAQLWVVPGGAHGPIFGDAAPAFARTALAFLA